MFCEYEFQESIKLEVIGHWEIIVNIWTLSISGSALST